jgi:hypothetical protein
MQEEKRDSALILIEQIRGHARLPDQVLDLLDDINSKLSISRHFLDQDQEEVWKVGQSSLYARIWRQLINLSIQLVQSLEQSTDSLPGCLPINQDDCVLVSQAIELKETILAEYWLMEIIDRRNEKQVQDF